MRRPAHQQKGPAVSVEHMCGKVWKPGKVADCPSKNHGETRRPQGGWRITISDDERIGK